MACIAVARVVHHLFEGELVEEDLCTYVHYCLIALAISFGKLVYGTRFI